MRKFIDQIGNEIILSDKIKTIVSIVPSQTELLFHLEMEEQVVGITKFCIKPENWFQSKRRVGGTKNLNIETILSLKPDLIIGNKEENNREDIEILQQYHQVWMSDIYTFQDNLQMILEVSRICNKESLGLDLIKKIKHSFNTIRIHQKTIKVLYFIWKNPYMVVGNSTFIHDQLEKCGFKNMAENLERYPEINMDQIKEMNPDYLLFSSEPFPFSDKNIEEMKNVFGKDKCILVDGEMFSWTGSRQLFSAKYFRYLLSSIR